MRYLGGKSRYAKQLIEVMQIPEDATYIEPFVGGASVISLVKCKRRIANDIHPNLIAMLKAVASGWHPPSSLSLEEWRALRARARHGEIDPLIGFAGFPCSYGGRWFEGYARTRKGDDSSGVARSAAASLVKQAPLLQGIEWHTGSYDQLDIPFGSVIYCDPPYIGTKGYSGTEKFDPHRFNYWCEGIKEELGCTIYMSEQVAYTPRWRELWSLERSTGLDQDGERKVVSEKLFRLD